jgi:hypothetical protein
MTRCNCAISRSDHAQRGAQAVHVEPVLRMIEHDAGEKPSAFDIIKLLRLPDVAAMLENARGYGRNDAGAVITGECIDILYHGTPAPC